MNARLERAAVAAPSRRTDRAPRPAEPPRRAPLRVVRPEERRDARRARRRARALAGMIVVIVAAGLFGVVALHVILTQNQFRLDSVRQQATAEQAKYERLRLEVAELESPQRIVDTAQQRLGMVTPPDVRYLTPPAGTSAASGGAAANGGSGTKAGKTGEAGAAPATTGPAPSGWAAVKPQLAPRP